MSSRDATPDDKVEFLHSYQVSCLLGLPFHCVTMAEAVGVIENAIDKHYRCFLSTPNLNFAMTAQSDPDFYQSLLVSDLSVADGMPLIWVAKLLGLPIHERVAGSDLFTFLSSKPRKQKIRVFFFGGETGIAEKAHDELNKTSPGMQSCGFYDPGFVCVEEMSNDLVIKQINACAPDFIVVALGAKKGQRWIMHNQDKLTAPVISHLGAVINFVAGNVQRAPEKWQRWGLEWIWRIKQEPKLYKRYLSDGLQFLIMLMSQTLPLVFYSKRLVKKADTSFGQVQSDTLLVDHTFNISLKGTFADGQPKELENMLTLALKSHKDVIIDGAELQFVSMETIARLLTFQGQLQLNHNKLLLKDFPAKILTLLRMSSVLDKFTLI